jgi:FkbM family methyltransferase
MKKIKHKGYEFEYRVGIDLDQIKLPFNMYYNKYKFKKTDIVLDIGAHIGTFCIPLAKKVKRIYAFEPFKESYDLLRNNIELNKINNILDYNMGINDKSGSVPLYKNKTNLGNSITNENSSGDYELIPVYSLRDLVNSIDSEIDFMKLNAEGAEYNIIMNTGKKDLLKIKRMSISYHNDMYTGEYNHLNIIKKLLDIGYKVKEENENEKRGIIYAKS